MAYLAVFVGGGGGSVLRFAMSKAIVANEWLQGHWATLHCFSRHCRCL